MGLCFVAKSNLVFLFLRLTKALTLRWTLWIYSGEVFCWLLTLTPTSWRVFLFCVIAARLFCCYDCVTASPSALHQMLYHHQSAVTLMQINLQSKTANLLPSCIASMATKMYSHQHHRRLALVQTRLEDQIYTIKHTSTHSYIHLNKHCIPQTPTCIMHTSSPIPLTSKWLI